MRIFKWRSENYMKRAGIFGVGYEFKKYYEVLNCQYDICVVIDNDEKKQGLYFNGKLCIEPSKILDYNLEVIIITPISKAIRNEIHDLLMAICNDLKVIYLDECIPPLFLRDTIVDSIVQEDIFGNQIVCEKGIFINKLSVRFSGINNKIIIHPNVMVTGMINIVCSGNSNLCEIGENTTIVAANFELSEAGKIIIGKDCMISWDVDIFQNAFHPIYSINTRERKNKAKNIIIGDHVWIGKGVGLLAGCNIGSGCSVGYKSVVSKKYPNNCTLAGCPAKIIYEDTCWERDTVGT